MLPGEGGMGLVYLAEQKEPVKRRIALKIIKPGMDSMQVLFWGLILNNFVKSGVEQ